MAGLVKGKLDAQVGKWSAARSGGWYVGPGYPEAWGQGRRGPSGCVALELLGDGVQWCTAPPLYRVRSAYTQYEPRNSLSASIQWLTASAPRQHIGTSRSAPVTHDGTLPEQLTFERRILHRQRRSICCVCRCATPERTYSAEYKLKPSPWQNIRILALPLSRSPARPACEMCSEMVRC